MTAYEVTFTMSCTGRVFIEADNRAEVRAALRALNAQNLKDPTTTKHMVEEVTAIDVIDVVEQTNFGR